MLGALVIVSQGDLKEGFVTFDINLDYFRNMEQSLLEQSYFPKDCKIKDALFYHDELLSQKILEC